MGARTKVNKAWLTAGEAAEYDRRVRLRADAIRTEDTEPLPASSRTHLRTIKRRYIGGSTAATVLTMVIAAVVSSSSIAPMLAGGFVAFMALTCGGLAYQAHIHHAYTTWIVEYLEEIGYPTRTGPPVIQRKNKRSRDHDDDPLGRTYPVTDGAYDPELYSRRGGYSTYEQMSVLGIDDYDTYKNNVLEAE